MTPVSFELCVKAFFAIAGLLGTAYLLRNTEGNRKRDGV